MSDLTPEQRALIDGIWAKAADEGHLLPDGRIYVTHAWMIETSDRVLDELREKEQAGEGDV